MRSLGFTLILALLAILVCGLAAWQWQQGNFDSLLGAPSVPVGQHLYDDFTPAEVKHIQVTQSGVSASFDLGPTGWQATTPWLDRMDPRAAVAIIHFTLGLRVEDFADRNEIDAQKAGLRENAIGIQLEDAKHQPVAKYKLGRQTPWLATVQDVNAPVPTVFILPRDLNHKRYLYSCTGDITAYFKDSLKFLRDHRPFYFNPTTLKKIHIRAEQGELTLGRESTTSPWRLVKPLDLPTDPKAIKSLLEGLYQLQALKLADRATVTLPANTALPKSIQIAILPFGTETETTLDIFPPESPAAASVQAIVSDRPTTLFELPLKPTPNVTSLADLPLAVNDLREPALTNLNIQSIRGILIQPTTGQEILISRTPPAPWSVTIGGVSQEANEERLFALLKTVTEGRATAFETDAATDFTPWGLNHPFLKLRFLGQDNQGLELAFGIDGKGGYFVNRLGTSTVMRIDPAVVAAIPVRPYEWRLARIWSIDRNNLMAIERQTGSEIPLTLRYDDGPGKWQATRDLTDLTTTLNPERANFLLGILEGLKITRWLATDDPSAATALLTPSLTFRTFERGTNDAGDSIGLITRSLILAPAIPGPNPGFYYGRLANDANPFLLDRDTYNKLATELLEK